MPALVPERDRRSVSTSVMASPWHPGRRRADGSTGRAGHAACSVQLTQARDSATVTVTVTCQ